MGNGSRTFMRVTNKDIFDSIEKLHTKIERLETKLELLENKLLILQEKLSTTKILTYGVYSVLGILIAIIVAHIMGA